MVSITRPERFRFARLKRSHIALTTIALLLVLDLGRSINARVGYATPVSEWQPSLSDYADLTWPPERTCRPTYLWAHVSLRGDVPFATDLTDAETDPRRR